MRNILRHVVSALFVLSAIAAVCITLYFSFPQILAQVSDVKQDVIYPEQEYIKKHISFGSKVVTAYVADNDKKRILGLSNRESLPESFAMLFVFPYEDTHGIWMKDMKFPIDILWLNERAEIVHIAEFVSPNSYPKKYYPDEKARYVVELNQGFVRENNLEIGNILTIY